MAAQRLIAGILLSAVSLLTRSASAQQVFESQRVRFQTEVVATGLKQPSAMVFLPDGRALLVERQKGVDLLDVKSGTVTLLEGGPEALIGNETGVHDANRPAALTGEDCRISRYRTASRLREEWLDLPQLLRRPARAQHHGSGSLPPA